MRWAEFALSYSGLVGLCLAMPKHHQQIWHRAPTKRRSALMRCLGWCALALSFSISVWINGWSFGPVEWAGTLAMTGVTLIVLLSFHPRLAAWLGVAALVIAPMWLLW